MGRAKLPAQTPQVPAESFFAFDLLYRYLTGLEIDVTAIESRVRHGVGSPESYVAAPVGTLYVRSDGGAGTTLYVKESGTGNTGWIAK